MDRHYFRRCFAFLCLGVGVRVCMCVHVCVCACVCVFPYASHHVCTCVILPAGCEPYTYGPGCVFDCGHCRLQKTCNAVTGLCAGGCMPGWRGDRCDQGESLRGQGGRQGRKDGFVYSNHKLMNELTDSCVCAIGSLHACC